MRGRSAWTIDRLDRDRARKRTWSCSTPRATPAMAHRMEAASGELAVELFALITMGDDRSVRETYVAGQPRKSSPHG